MAKKMEASNGQKKDEGLVECQVFRVVVEREEACEEMADR